jgi:hypothetical protein
VDGELACRLPVEIEFVPDMLTLLMPPAYANSARDFEPAHGRVPVRSRVQARV